LSPFKVFVGPVAIAMTPEVEELAVAFTSMGARMSEAGLGIIIFDLGK
jgi:hypothetical protein